MNDDALTFFELDDSEKNRYMTLCNIVNKINKKLDKSASRLPLKLALACFTGGYSLLVSVPLHLRALDKKYTAIRGAKNCVDEARRRRDRRHINWNSFPSAHIVIGGDPLIPVRQVNKDKTRCPICSKCQMRQFTASSEHEISACGACDHIIVVRLGRTATRTHEVTVPGLLLAVPFTGDLAELALDVSDDLADILSATIDLV